MYRQYGDYFGSFYLPLLLLFGIVSVLLGSMQLAATIEQYDAHWRGLVGMFCISSAVITVLAFILLVTPVGNFPYKITEGCLRCAAVIRYRRRR